MLKDTTFILTKEGNLHAFYSSNLNSNDFVITVYDRDSKNGLKNLKITDIKLFLDENSSDFRNTIREFLTIVVKDEFLKDDTNLKTFIVETWNNVNHNLLENLDFEDHDIRERLVAYFEHFLNKYPSSELIVKYFIDYYLCQWHHPRCCQEWLDEINNIKK